MQEMTYLLFNSQFNEINNKYSGVVCGVFSIKKDLLFSAPHCFLVDIYFLVFLIASCKCLPGNSFKD